MKKIACTIGILAICATARAEDVAPVEETGTPSLEEQYAMCIDNEGQEYCDVLFGYTEPWQPAMYKPINFYIGGGIGYLSVAYDKAVINTNYAPDGFMDFDIYAGINFFGSNKTYNPGISMFYNTIKEYTESITGVADAEYSIDGSIVGVMFDNYINDHRGNSFVFSVGYADAKIKEKADVGNMSVDVSTDVGALALGASVAISITPQSQFVIQDRLYIPTKKDTGVERLNMISAGVRLLF